MGMMKIGKGIGNGLLDSTLEIGYQDGSVGVGVWSLILVDVLETFA